MHFLFYCNIYFTNCLYKNLINLFKLNLIFTWLITFCFYNKSQLSPILTNNNATTSCYISKSCPYKKGNHSGGVIVSVVASSVVDRGFETKDHKTGICCFYAKHTALRSKIKTGWLVSKQNSISTHG
jgi:hypothetical protein